MNQQNELMFQYKFYNTYDTGCTPYDVPGLYCRPLHKKNTNLETNLLQGEQSQPVIRKPLDYDTNQRLEKQSYVPLITNLRDSKSAMSEIPLKNHEALYSDVIYKPHLQSVDTRNIYKK